MPARARVPDAFFHLALWLGIVVFVIMLGIGFAAQASDRSPWPWWLGSVAAFLPFALIVWLRKTGRIELIDTEESEQRSMDRFVDRAVRIFVLFPRSWRLALWVMGTIAVVILNLAIMYLGWNSDVYADRLAVFSGRFAHPEYAAWLLIAVGLIGAAYETFAVIRDAKVRGTPGKEP